MGDHAPASFVPNQPIMKQTRLSLFALLLLLCPAIGAAQTANQVFDSALQAFREKNWTVAADGFVKYTGMQPADSAGFYNLALCYTNLKRDADAVPNFRKAMALSKAPYSAAMQLGNTHLRLSQYQEAITAFNAAAAADPAKADPHYGIGLAHRRNKNEPDAETALAKAVAVGPVTAAFHYQLAASQYSQKKYKPAIINYREVTRLDPKHYNAWVFLGNSLDYDGQLAEAIKAYESAVVIDPTAPEASSELAVLYSRDKKPQLCETHARKALVLNSKYATAHKTLGVCLRLQKRYSDAVQSGLEAVRLDPKYVEGYRSLGFTYVAIRTQERLAKRTAQANSYDTKAREAVAKIKELGADASDLETAVNKP